MRMHSPVPEGWHLQAPFAQHGPKEGRTLVDGIVVFLVCNYLRRSIEFVNSRLIKNINKTQHIILDNNNIFLEQSTLLQHV